MLAINKHNIYCVEQHQGSWLDGFSSILEWMLCLWIWEHTRGPRAARIHNQMKGMCKGQWIDICQYTGILTAEKTLGVSNIHKSKFMRTGVKICIAAKAPVGPPTHCVRMPGFKPRLWLPNSSFLLIYIQAGRGWCSSHWTSATHTRDLDWHPASTCAPGQPWPLSERSIVQQLSVCVSLHLFFSHCASQPRKEKKKLRKNSKL